MNTYEYAAKLCRPGFADGVVKGLAEVLAREVEIGRSRMEAMDLSPEEIEALIAYARRMHAGQLLRIHALLTAPHDVVH